MPDLSVANYALRLAKVGRISSFSQPGSSAARILNDIFDDLRREFLRRRAWRFNRKLAVLPSDDTPPLFGQQYSYTMPPDCVRIISVSDLTLTDNEMPDGYVLRGRKIHTDMGPSLPIEYGADVDDFTQWDPSAKRLFEYELALEIGPELGTSAARIQQINTKIQELQNDSVVANAIEATEENYLDADDQDFMGSRFWG